MVKCRFINSHPPPPHLHLHHHHPASTFPHFHPIPGGNTVLWEGNFIQAEELNFCVKRIKSWHPNYGKFIHKVFVQKCFNMEAGAHDHGFDKRGVIYLSLNQPWGRFSLGVAMSVCFLSLCFSVTINKFSFTHKGD